MTGEQVVATRGENSVTRYHQRGVNGSREFVKVLGKAGNKVDEHAQVERWECQSRNAPTLYYQAANNVRAARSVVLQREQEGKQNEAPDNFIPVAGNFVERSQVEKCRQACDNRRLPT